MVADISSAEYQTGDTAFAAACSVLGCPIGLSVTDHLAAKSQTPNVRHIIWRIGNGGVYDPQDLAAAWQVCVHPEKYTAPLRTQCQEMIGPWHPLRAALKGIENFSTLIKATEPNSKLRGLTQDRRFVASGSASVPRRTIITEKAAALAVCGAPLLWRNSSGFYQIQDGTCDEFPGLNSAVAVFACHAIDAELALPRNAAHGIQHILPGFPAGEHPLHYAYLAIRAFVSLSHAATRHPAAWFLRDPQSSRSAKIPQSSTTEEQQVTAAFLARGKAALL